MTRGAPVTVSLCVVARNEAAFLGACLESARDVADEMIVVDTGSTDATRAVARAAGARTFSSAWPGDLGRAHNLPLAHARGEWILSLDADEVLDPTARHRIRPLLRTNDRVAGYRLPIRNYVYQPVAKFRLAERADVSSRGALGYLPTSPVRLFRRHPAHRFSGLLHQTMAPSILRRGGVIAEMPVVIHHYGPLRFDRAKSALYRILARRQVAATPNDPRVWLDFGLLFSAPADLPAALEAFRRARELGDRASASFYMGFTLIEMGRARAAVRLLQDAVRNNADDGAPFFDRADALELLGYALECSGRPSAAERAYRRAIAALPASPGALTNLAGLLIDRGALDAAAPVARRLVQLFPGLADAWAILGALRLRQGDGAAASRAYEAALEIDPGRRALVADLALAHETAGRPRVAARIRRIGADTERRDRGAGGPRPGVPTSARRRRERGGGTVSIAGRLDEDTGPGVLAAIEALPGRAHVVLHDAPVDPGSAWWLSGLRSAGIPTRAVSSSQEIARIIADRRPDVVLHHGGETVPLMAPVRQGRERWIAVGYTALAMPSGYDEYIVFSEFHRCLQRAEVRPRTHRIPCGVRTRRSGAASVASARRRVTVVMLSPLCPGRFPRHLLAYLPPLDALGARLLIAGGGARRYELQDEIAARGLAEVIRFVGPISWRRRPAFLASGDVGLHLTESYQEVSGHAVLQMLAAGLPVVAEPKGCLPELVIPGRNGFLASGPEAIARHLADLIRSSRLRGRMGAAGRRLARAHGPAAQRRAMQALLRSRRTRDPGTPDRPAVDRPTAHERASLARWRPWLTYFICAASPEAGAALGHALSRTGIAGCPRDGLAAAPPDGRDRRWAECLPHVLEAAATPNGVSGLRVSFNEFRRLVRAVGGGREPGRGAARAVAAACPGLRYVWIRSDSEPRPRGFRVARRGESARRGRGIADAADAEAPAAMEANERAWRRYFAADQARPVIVRHEAVRRDPSRAARMVLTQLRLGRRGSRP